MEPIETPTPIVEPDATTGETPVEAAGPAPLEPPPAAAAYPPAIAHEPSIAISPAAPSLPVPRHGRVDLYSETVAALGEARRALTDCIAAASDEMAGLTLRGIDTAARSAVEMLAVKNVADAVAVNGGFARACFGNWAGGSAKLSELGVRLTAESSRPFFDRLVKRGGGPAR